MSENPMTVLRSMNKDAKLTIFYIGECRISAESRPKIDPTYTIHKTFSLERELFFKTFGDGESLVYFCAPKIHDGQRR
jgi:hypothetical protein